MSYDGAGARLSVFTRAWDHSSGARCFALAMSPPGDPDSRPVAGSYPSAGLRAADGVYHLWNYRCGRAAELEREGIAMKRPPEKKPLAPSAPSGKQYMWSIYHIKGTPAALLGRVEAPNEETAIKKAIDEFQIGAALRNRLLAQRR
jgi:hypothetical protein